MEPSSSRTSLDPKPDPSWDKELEWGVFASAKLRKGLGIYVPAIAHDKGSLEKIFETRHETGTKQKNEKNKSKLEKVKKDVQEALNIQSKNLVDDEIPEELRNKIRTLAASVRVTHYFNEKNEVEIQKSGYLASAYFLAGGQGIESVSLEKIPNKSSKTDEGLGNTDHVFFFLEYTEHAKFRETPFGGPAIKGKERVLPRGKYILTGEERRVSFPLKEIMRPGTFGYTEDLGEKGTFNAENLVFGAGGKRGQVGAEEFMLNLARLTLPKKEKININSWKNLSEKDLFEMLTRYEELPDPTNRSKKRKTVFDPQILVPRKVSLATTGAVFQQPTDLGFKKESDVFQKSMDSGFQEQSDIFQKQTMLE